MKIYVVYSTILMALALVSAPFFGSVINHSTLIRKPAESQAEGGGGGGMDGGGGSFVNIGGKITISDLYYKSVNRVTPTPIKPVSYKELPQSVRTEVERILDWKRKTSPKDFVDELSLQIKSYQRNYLLVPKGFEDKAVCNDYLAELNTKVDGHYRFGCTNGEVTFLFVDKLQTADATQQAYGIIHERLWAAFRDITQEQVTSIIRVTELSEQIAKEQRNGQHLVLNQSEISELDQVYVLESNLASGKLDVTGSTSTAFNVARTPGGGLMATFEKDNLPVISNSIIGIGSNIGIGAKITNSLILASQVSGDQLVGCKVINSEISVIAFNSEFVNSEVTRSGYYSYKDKTKGSVSNLRVTDSNVTFLFDTVSVGDTTAPNTIEASHVALAVTGKSFHLKKVVAEFDLILGDNVTLQNFNLVGNSSNDAIEWGLITINKNTNINGFNKQLSLKSGVFDKRLDGRKIKDLSEAELHWMESGKLEIGASGSVKHGVETIVDQSGHSLDLNYSKDIQLIDNR